MSKFQFGEDGTITVRGINLKYLDRVWAWMNMALAQGLARHLLFMGATAFVILLTGYHFGTYDQAIHIPSLKKFADPSLYPGDAFMDLRFEHFSYFWLLFVPVYQLGMLEVTLFILHIAATYFTFWAIWNLSDALFENRLACIISVVTMVLPHLPFGGWTIFEFSLLNRTFVFPFLLFAISLYVKRRYLLAFALLGLMYNLHALSANFVLAMFVFDSLVQWRKRGVRSIVSALGTFVVLALPVLVWKLSVPSEAMTLNPEWLSIIGNGALSNTYFMFAPVPYILLMTASGMASIVLYVIARHVTPDVRKNRTLTNFMVVLLLLLVLQVVTVQWFPVTIIIQAQIIRAGVFVLLLSYLCFAYYLARLFQTKGEREMEPALLSLALLFPFAFIPVICWLVQRFCAARAWRWIITLGLVGAAFAGSSLFVLYLSLWNPVIHIYPPHTPWYDVQVWARDHSPRSAVFITPSHLWSYHEPDWRVFSERSTVVTLPELMEVAFAPDYLDTWKERFEVIVPGALERLDGNAGVNKQIVTESYYSLSEQDIVRAGCRFHATYLVVEKPHRYSFAGVYENENFIVYAIPSETCNPTAHPR